MKLASENMATLRVNYVYFWVLLGVITVQLSNSSGNPCLLREKEAALFVFGDSLFDAGINNYLTPSLPVGKANYPPYGQTFFNYPTRRFSDGRVIPDFIAEHAKLPLILPYLHPDSVHYYVYGINFASAGAGDLIQTAPPQYMRSVLDLNTQVSYYKDVSNALRKKLGNAEAKALLSKAVHLINIGANDYGQRFIANITVLQRYSKTQFVDIVIGNITNAIKEIHNLGGRKFAFVNVGPFGCSPGVRIFLKEYELPRMLQKLQKQLVGFKYSVFDLYTSASQLMKYPSKYGFKEGKAACCGGGACRGDDSCWGKRGIEKYELCEYVNDYLFFDSNHSTDMANLYFSNLMLSANLTFNKPYNMKQLFEL